MKSLVIALIAGSLFSAAYADDSQQNGSSLQNNCTFTKEQRQNWCVVTGILAIPFKLELTGNKDVFDAANLSGFVGTNVSSYLTIFGFAGYSANLNSSTNTTTSNSSSASTGAVSYGIGLAIPVGATTTAGANAKDNSSKMHVGALIGFDHEGSSLNYAYNNKPWLSFFVGASF